MASRRRGRPARRRRLARTARRPAALPGDDPARHRGPAHDGALARSRRADRRNPRDPRSDARRSRHPPALRVAGSLDAHRSGERANHRIFVRYVDKLEIARLSPIENHQGVVAIVQGKTGVELDELLLHLDTLSDPALVLVVDSLQDPQNFGVLLRSAEGAGVDGVVIPHHRSVGLTPAVAKTSSGASEHLLIADVANLRQAIDALKEKGIWVVAADETGDLLYDEVDYRGPTALVVGGEGEGIRRLVLEGADQVVRLPMEGQVASLNASAAGTVLLYEALRQRRAPRVRRRGRSTGNPRRTPPKPSPLKPRPPSLSSRARPTISRGQRRSSRPRRRRTSTRPSRPMRPLRPPHRRNRRRHESARRKSRASS
ncbi:MAG: 23S rRNA (guanosine(2251)-2'-O)-methyltransferase RlmB [Chloroflexi bacterium]|nr:MAG: 23S rRNA (guanosine(2251)-2'-O)-methyltransferase RlmB [Chloroflexota bacterium]